LFKDINFIQRERFDTTGKFNRNINIKRFQGVKSLGSFIVTTYQTLIPRLDTYTFGGIYYNPAIRVVRILISPALHTLVMPTLPLTLTIRRISILISDNLKYNRSK